MPILYLTVIKEKVWELAPAPNSHNPDIHHKMLIYNDDFNRYMPTEGRGQRFESSSCALQKRNNSYICSMLTFTSMPISS